MNKRIDVYATRKVFVALLLFLAASLCQAQVYCGEHKYDGQHKNEVTGYLQGGDNIVTDFFLGPSVSYKRHFTDRWAAEGAVDIPFGKGKYGVSVKGGYRLPLSYFNFYFTGKVMYNRYNDFNTNEYNYNLSIIWEAPYFEIVVGQSIINYHLLGSSYTEPLTLTFGAGLNIRPRWNSWNIGLFFRNYDDFYYENWNINWGFRFNGSLNKTMKLFGEFNIRPAGSMSQLASRYETSLKLGLKYLW